MVAVAVEESGWSWVLIKRTVIDMEFDDDGVWRSLLANSSMELRWPAGNAGTKISLLFAIFLLLLLLLVSWNLTCLYIVG